MDVHALFGEMSDVVDRIQALRGAAERSGAGIPAGDPTRAALDQIVGKADAARRLIVATKEGGAITGELRIREYTDDVYGAVLGYEGRPATYLIERTASLRRELADVRAQVDALERSDVPHANALLRSEGRPEMDPRVLLEEVRASEVPGEDGESPAAAARERD